MFYMIITFIKRVYYRKQKLVDNRIAKMFSKTNVNQNHS